MLRRLRPLFLVLAAATSAASKVSHPAPDFTGRWVMDTVKSTRDGILTSLTMVVRRSGDTLFLLSDGANAQGAFTTNSLYDVAGRPTTNHMGGIEFSAQAAWRGDTLVLTSAGNAQGMTIRVEDAWSLDATGSELTRRENLWVGGQLRTEVLVLRKPANKATPTAFLTTVGKDTFCLEQFTRDGNVVTGSWVVLHPPGVFVHDYRITLDKEGLPAEYTMKYSTPGAPTPPRLDSVTVKYGRDSATMVMFLKDSTTTKRIAMREAFPLLGQSYVGVELALQRMRRMHQDSAAVTLHGPTEPNRPAASMPIRFFADSATIGAGLRAQVGGDGAIVGLRSGPMVLQRVAPFDMPALVNGFVKSMAPRMATVVAQMASRKEIVLPTEQRDRFVGAYTIGPATIAVARAGDHLTFQPPGQQPVQLLAMSATEFFVKDVDFVVSFDSDSTGRVAGLTISQGAAKQRLVRRP